MPGKEEDGGEGGGGIIARLALSSQGKVHSKPHTSKEVIKEEKMEDVIKITHQLYYNELRVAPEEHALLITESVFTDYKARERTTRMFFEEFGAKAIMFVTQEFLSMIASGNNSALVINVGNTYASIVPIWNMNIFRHKAQVLPVGGQDVTRALQLLLTQNRGHQVYSTHDFKTIVVEQIKERHAYVAIDYEMELITKPETLKKDCLPDLQTVELGRELFQCTECLFQPHLFGIYDTPGLIEGVNEVINSLDNQLKEDLISGSTCIILTGSSTMFRGFQERLEAGLQKERPKIKVVAPPERKLSAWIGGSIWAELSMNRNSWTTLEEYKEFGPAVVHSKCF